MCPNVLNKKQKKIIEHLDFLGKNFYLAGGTGLALQLGHRTSVDFDFYTPTHFSSEKILADFQKKFKNLTVRRTTKDTLIITVNKIELSFFYYPYKLLKPTVLFETVKLASAEDIAAMKIVAIIQRGRRRDFIDIFYLLGKYPLEEIIKFVLKKYPGYQKMLILRALIYFEEAEKEKLGRAIKLFDKNFSWK
ncbi:hypothetical protein COU96_02975, partial [Candidatus Shapirobacteria bacterium CG10_big_fil_rev_8_21_14_0_10_38_14]